ncbi:NUDIX hydrolase [Roseinatronobacter alkalisoli]|uniref:NUDIX hydrolase n=1 Tax=Roseinatronobacter alkalisoli TaxID=3028235 RepID=A0ABT5T397_9RHOB|nr:NUDIX hydrolase [Roseinatronobacter sp. HJB301]MDD7969581.1 NUDIX hydrolase [Roseinatronobacter sp. HJB301]
MTAAVDKTAIRHAATVLLVRAGSDGPQVLMGQRGSRAAFMPDKFVFPGGAVDASDFVVPLARPLDAECAARLSLDPPGPQALAAAAIRELWEETGLMLGVAGAWPSPPADWQRFAEHGLLPDASGLRYIFRAITPPGRPRRFDARFFLADAGHVVGDLDDFSAACEELSHLHWVPFATARKLNLPFITEVVLAEAQARIMGEDMPPSVPFFDNSTGVSRFHRIEL